MAETAAAQQLAALEPIPRFAFGSDPLTISRLVEPGKPFTVAGERGAIFGDSFIVAAELRERLAQVDSGFTEIRLLPKSGAVAGDGFFVFPLARQREPNAVPRFVRMQPSEVRSADQQANEEHRTDRQRELPRSAAKKDRQHAAGGCESI